MLSQDVSQRKFEGYLMIPVYCAVKAGMKGITEVDRKTMVRLLAFVQSSPLFLSKVIN